MKCQVNSTNTIPPPEGNCMENSTLNLLKYFIISMSCHIFGNLFHLSISHGV